MVQESAGEVLFGALKGCGRVGGCNEVQDIIPH